MSGVINVGSTFKVDLYFDFLMLSPILFAWSAVGQNPLNFWILTVSDSSVTPFHWWLIIIVYTDVAFN